jgi:RND family efflux transporter MFP subunit
MPNLNIRTIVGCLLLWFSFGALAQEHAALVKVTKSIDGHLSNPLRLTGTVYSGRKSVLTGVVAGRVDQVFVTEGDRVERGQELIQLDQQPLKLAHKEKKAELSEARARLQLAELADKRAQDLFTKEVGSQSDRDRAHLEATAWKGRMAALQANLEGLERDLKDTVIRAPFKGVVVMRHTSVGQWLAVGGDVLELVSTEVPRVSVKVPESKYHLLRSGAPASIRFDALPGHVIDHISGSRRRWLPCDSRDHSPTSI